MTDASGRIVYMNPRAEQLTGYPSGQLLGRRVELLVPWRLRSVHSGLRERFYSSHAGPRPMGEATRQIWLRQKDGRELAVDIALGPLESSSGRLTVAVIRDISERQAMEAALEHRALHDPLTDLPNRTLFFDRLRQAILSGRRDRKQVALMLLDLDRFKRVNDVYGHAVGDALLRKVSKRLTEGRRGTDTVARIGGDEFAALLRGVAGREASVRMVRKLLNSLKAPFSIGRRRIALGASAGIALFPDDGEDVDALLRRADAAMYQAKREGTGVASYRP